MNEVHQTYERRAASGARFLDRFDPNWETRIIPDVLDLYDGCNCILGQLEGSYLRGEIKYGLTPAGARAFGFVLQGRQMSNYARLTREWLKQLRNRGIRFARLPVERSK